VDYVPVLALRLGAREEEQRRIRELQGSVYIALWREQARLKEGAAEILGWLRERGYRLGLATSGGRGHVAHCLERFALGGLFEVVLTKDDVASRKPDPEIYVRCAGHFRVDPGGMLVVEDSEPGVRAARSAGARCVALLTPHVPAERVAQADAVIASLLELRGLLE
jgi:HAD superfamily hydrolase (TIGR01509 family)